MERNDLVDYLANFYQIRVVYYADQEVDDLCRKLTGCSMPEKFSVFIDNAYVRDISGNVTSTVQRRIGFRFIEARSLAADYTKSKYDQTVGEWFDDESAALSPFLGSGVGHAYVQSTDQAGKLMASMQNCPWYSAYRSAVIETSESSDVEFISSCVSCVFLTSELAESPPSNLVTLAKQHDERSSIRLSNTPQNASPATPVGPTRHLLMPCPRCCAVVFSPSSPTDTGAGLNASIEQARTLLPGLLTQAVPFVPIDNTTAAKPSSIVAGLFARLARDVVLPSLLQWSERQLIQLNELLNSRRGISTSLRTIFSAGSKPSAKISLPARGSAVSLGGSNGQAMVGSSADVVYTDESAEIQLRRLSDVALLMGAFDIAFEGYHRLKDDFQRDQALLPQATAFEAAAIALLLHPQPPSRRYPSTCLKYLENALSIYQSLVATNPRAQYLATRCGLLFADTLRSLKMFPEAAAVFARLAPEMSVAPEFELRSAVALEQAAHCWATLRPTPRLRKAALNLLLAGARYSRAGRRKHALRCYQTALPTYAGRGLALAEDHVLLTIGRQSFALRDLRTAVEAFAGLLCHHNDTKNLHQTTTTQGGFLREYLYVAKRYQEQTSQSSLAEGVVISPVPIFPSTCLLTVPSIANYGPTTSISLPGADDWQVYSGLEEIAVKALMNSVIMRPAVFLFNSKIPGKQPAKGHETPMVFAGEQFLLLVDVENPLDVPLLLNNLSVLGLIDADSVTRSQEAITQGVTGKYQFGHGEPGDYVALEAPQSLDLQPRQCTRFVIRVMCSLAGRLKISEICGQLSTSIPTEEQQVPMSIHAHWQLDTPWTVDVHESAGCISAAVKIDEIALAPYIPGTLLPMKITFTLSGDRAGSDYGVKGVVLSTNRSDCVQLLDGFTDVQQTAQQQQQSGQQGSQNAANSGPGQGDSNKSWRIPIPESAAKTPTWSINALLRIAPNSKEITSSIFSFSLLLAYEPIKRIGKRRYRLFPVLVRLPICETPFLLSVAATPHPASPIGLLNVRDCVQFSLGFSASLMAISSSGDGQTTPTQAPWSFLQLHRLALVSASININNSNKSDEMSMKSTSRVVNTIVISRRETPLVDSAVSNLDLLSHCSLSTVIGSDFRTTTPENGFETNLQAIVRMAVSAHRPSVYSNVSSASRLHGIFVFQWALASSNGTLLVRGCNFVVDPPLFPGDQFSSAVFAASDPSISARRIGFGMGRASTVSAMEGSTPSPIVVHIEYPQVVDVEPDPKDGLDEDYQKPFRIKASVFCRNRSSSRVELVDCNLPVPAFSGSSEDIYGSSGLLWLAPQPIWPISMEPGQAICIPLTLLATHSGVFRPLPPTIELIVPPSSSKTSIRPDFGPFIYVNYVAAKT